MSRTTLYVAREDGLMLPDGDYDAGSSFLAGFWPALTKEYLGWNNCQHVDRLMNNGLQPLWDLVGAEDVPLAYRIVLATTFDRALAQPEDALLVAAALTHTREWLKPIEAVDRALLRMEQRFFRMEFESGIRAVGWRWTSVAEDLWWVREGEEEGRRYNLLTDTGHTWLREIL